MATMCHKQLDMPAARYVCYANEGFISYRIGAKRQYIDLEQSENISSGRSSHIDKRKNKSKNRRIFSFYSCSFLFVKFSLTRK